MIHHFLIALLLAIVLVPRALPSLNEIDHKLVREYKAQPVYLLQLDEKQYELDYRERDMINPRWIDELKLYTEKDMPPMYVEKYQAPLVLISLKKRKVDDLKETLQRFNVSL
ncbi:MAG: hypothetical protein ACLFUB_19455 [Cyclobacteriaceae bacterium]